MTDQPPAEPRLVHGDRRHITGPFDLRVMYDGVDVTIQPTDAELWRLLSNITDYLATREVHGK
jgi:hypothetical protein